MLPQLLNPRPYFASLPDPRRETRNKLHKLQDILMIVLCVRLAYWFDEQFPPPDRRRSYARSSRRQSSTPDIPWPSIIPPPEEEQRARVFGVVLDTSGSIEPRLLGKALGAIASYAQAREVFAVRLIYCDATAYDAGWLPPEALLERVAVKGRCCNGVWIACAKRRGAMIFPAGEPCW